MNTRERADLDRHITGNYGEDQFADDEPQEDDGYITDIVRGGYDVSFAEKFVGHFSDYDDAETALKDAIRESQFFPNCWFIDDHGGSELISVTDNGDYFVQD